MTDNNLRPRPYDGLHDLEKIKALIVAGRKVTPHSAYPHIGDLDWWIFYGAPIRNEPLNEIIWLWENDAGKLAAWVYFTPHACEFEMALLPEYRATPCEEQIVIWAEQELAERAKSEEKPVGTFASADDAARIAILEGRGYTASDFLVYFSQPLNVSLPEPVLPDGFTFLDAMREEFADKRADVHFNSFNPSRMTGEAYRNFMHAPNYDPALDIVTVAPDGQFAAFAMGWIDTENQLSIFEPVGTRSTMQRMGLGKTTLLEGMRRLKARGVHTATVCTHAHNAGNIAFYQSAGFQLTNTIQRFEKSVS